MGLLFKLFPSDRAKGCLKILFLLLLLLILVKVALYFYPKIFPTEENLNITEWETYTEYFGQEPLFEIKYPKGWQVKTTGSGGSGPHTEIRSPWNKKNNKEGNFILIDIHWDSEKGWNGTGDPVIGSDINSTKVPIVDEYFTRKNIDSYKAILAKDGVLNKDNIYIYTYSHNFLYSDIFRFELYCSSKNNFQQAKNIYYKIVSSFNFLE